MTTAVMVPDRHKFIRLNCISAIFYPRCLGMAPSNSSIHADGLAVHRHCYTMLLNAIKRGRGLCYPTLPIDVAKVDFVQTWKILSSYSQRVAMRLQLSFFVHKHARSSAIQRLKTVSIPLMHCTYWIAPPY
jgi:hypothetical protein